MPEHWYLGREGHRFGPFPLAQLKQLAASGQLARTDLVWQPGLGAWRPAGEIPELFPAPVAAPAPAPPPAPTPAPTPRPAAAAEVAAVVFHDCGELIDEQFQRCRSGLGPAGLSPERLLFFGPTRTEAPSAGKARAILHVALTPEEIAVVHLEDTQVRATRGLLDEAGWTMQLVETHPMGLSLGGGGKVRMSNKVKPTRKVVLELDLPRTHYSLDLVPGAGAQALKERLSRAALERARAYMAAGAYLMAERLLARVEADTPSAAEVPPLRPRLAAAVQVEATYLLRREDTTDRVRGTLRVDLLGLEFAPSASPGRSLRLHRADLRGVRQPQPGDFPDELIRQAQSAAPAELRKLAGRAGAADAAGAANVADRMYHGNDARARLGPPPRNRLVIDAVAQGRAVQLVFDVAAPTTKEMEEQATLFWNCLAQTLRGS